MAVNRTYETCPYTLTPLADLEHVNDEHIFPDAIGGTKEYSVRVSADKNSELGTTIDAPLVDSALIGALRLVHGIKSRSGPPKWKLRGKTSTTQRDVDVVFPEEGDTKIRMRKPVEMDDAGAAGKIIITPDKRDAFLTQFIKNHRKKGKTVQLTGESRVLGEPIEVDLSVDLIALRRGLLKIAFLGLYQFLGDVFLGDPLVEEWHRAIFAEDPEDAKQAKIHGVAFDCDEVMQVMIPDLQPYEHAVSVANLQQCGPVVAVALFGKGFHSLLALGSETDTYGLDVLEGNVVICDAKNGKVRSMRFEDHLIASAPNLPIW